MGKEGESKHFDEVRRGLESLDTVFNKNEINYRILGSLLVASLNGKPHRTLGDVDVLVGDRDFDRVTRGLVSLGYSLEKKSKWGFRWLEAIKKDSLGFTFLLVGRFTDDGFSCFLTKQIGLVISSGYLLPTKYSLFGVSFTGIPQRSIYEGLKVSNLNPKRSLDRKVVLSHFKGEVPDGEKLEDSFRLFIFGKEIPRLYQLFSWLYNIFGGVRVAFEKKYEVWG